MMKIFTGIKKPLLILVIIDISLFLIRLSVQIFPEWFSIILSINIIFVAWLTIYRVFHMENN